MNLAALQKKTIKTALFLAVLGTAVYFVFFTHQGEKLIHTNVPQLADNLRSFGKYAEPIGMFAVVLQMFIPYLPFVVVAGANVLMLGFWWGFTVNYTMSVLGTLLSFLFARYSAKKWVEDKLRAYPQLLRFNAGLKQHGFYYIFVGRLIPVIPSTVINWGSGVSKVSWKSFLTATALGNLPMVFMESLVGHDLLHFKHHKLRLLTILIVFSMLIWLGSRLKKSSGINPAAQVVLEDRED